MIRTIAHFTGQYKTLMPAGYEFLKLYASNYRTYRKKFGNCDDSIWIFVKGNEIEVMDFYSKTGWLINCFIKNRDKIHSMVENDYFSIRMNTKTGKIWQYDMNTRRYIYRLEKKLYKDGNEKALDIYYKRWKTSHIEISMVEEVLRLWDAGLIELVDIEIPEK